MCVNIIINMIKFKLFIMIYSEYDEDNRVSPEKGNVVFSSAEMRWCFTLETFAQMYSDTYGKIFISLSYNFYIFIYIIFIYIEDLYFI